MLGIIALLAVAAGPSPEVHDVCGPAVDVVTRFSYMEKTHSQYRSPEQLDEEYSRKIEFMLLAKEIPAEDRNLWRATCRIYLSGAIRGYGNLLKEFEQSTVARRP